MSELQSFTLGEVTVNYDSQRVPVRAADRTPGPYPYYGASGIVDSVSEYLFDGTYLLIAEDGENLRTRKTPIAFMASGKFWVNNHAHVVQGNDLASTEYLAYALSQADVSGYLSGSTQPKLTQDAMNRIRLLLPDRFHQDAIAEVLGALDNKIAVNDRIADVATRLAQAIFSSLSSEVELGPDTFGSVASVFGGGTPRTSDPSYWNGGIAWATPSDVTSLQAPYLFKTERTISDAGLTNCASRLYPCGSIFMTSRATIGAFAIPQVPCAVNQGFIVVVPPKAELRWWLLHEMRSRVDEMLGLANGSTFLELSRTNFKKMPVRLASVEVITQFHEKVDPLHGKAAASEMESSTLRSLRDTLLPNLMSGEIRVQEAERIVEDVT